MLGAGNRMRRDEMHVGGQVGTHVAHDRAFDRADVGHDRSRLEMRRDLLGDVAARADRSADDDEIGAGDRGGVGFDHLVGEPEFGDAPARRGGARGRHDFAHGALRARRARDRGADQADADQRQTIKQRCGFGSQRHAGFARNSLSAATTRRFASSVPTVMRSAFGSL